MLRLAQEIDEGDDEEEAGTRHSASGSGRGQDPGGRGSGRGAQRGRGGGSESVNRFGMIASAPEEVKEEEEAGSSGEEHDEQANRWDSIVVWALGLGLLIRGALEGLRPPRGSTRGGLSAEAQSEGHPCPCQLPF